MVKCMDREFLPSKICRPQQEDYFQCVQSLNHQISNNYFYRKMRGKKVLYIPEYDIKTDSFIHLDQVQQPSKGK